MSTFIPMPIITGGGSGSISSGDLKVLLAIYIVISFVSLVIFLIGVTLDYFKYRKKGFSYWDNIRDGVTGDGNIASFFSSITFIVVQFFSVIFLLVKWVTTLI